MTIVGKPSQVSMAWSVWNQQSSHQDFCSKKIPVASLLSVFTLGKPQSSNVVNRSLGVRRNTRKHSQIGGRLGAICSTISQVKLKICYLQPWIRYWLFDPVTTSPRTKWLASCLTVVAFIGLKKRPKASQSQGKGSYMYSLHSDWTYLNGNFTCRAKKILWQSNGAEILFIDTFLRKICCGVCGR